MSLNKMWPDFTLEETGYEQLYEEYRFAEAAGQKPVVVDAMTFSENPERILAAYCDRLGAPFRPTSLSWEQRGSKKGWDEWEG